MYTIPSGFCAIACLIYIIHRCDVIFTSRDTNQTQKQANNGDKGYMQL